MAFLPSRKSPGACLMMSTSGAEIPLVISLSAPLRSTSARESDPVCSIAAEKPCAIDNTDTSTITTPAMPTMATPEEPSRCGMVLKFNIVTANVWEIKFTSGPPQRVGDLQVHRRERRQRAGDQSEHDDHHR